MILGSFLIIVLFVIILKFKNPCTLQFSISSPFPVPIHVLYFPDDTRILHIVLLKTKAEIAQKFPVLPREAQMCPD